MLGAAVHGEGGDVLVIEPDMATIGLYQARHDIKCSGFTRPIRPQQAHDLPLLDKEADITHHLTAAIALANVFQLDFHRPHCLITLWPPYRYPLLREEKLGRL
jgi:hypothetical protein